MPNGTLALREGRHVFHAHHGMMRVHACNVTEVIAGHEVTVHILISLRDQLRLHIPVAKASEVLRKITNDDFPDKVFKTLKGDAKKSRQMWSRRSLEFDAKLNSGNFVAIAEVVRDTHPDKVPAPSYSENLVYEAAVTRLISAVAAAYDKSETEAAAMLSKKSGKRIECVRTYTPEHVKPTSADPFAAQPYRRETPDIPSEMGAFNGTKHAVPVKPTATHAVPIVATRSPKPEPKPTNDERRVPMDVKQETTTVASDRPSELASIRERLAERSRALEEANGRIESLEQDVDKLSGQLTAKAHDNTSLEERLAASEERCGQLDAKLAEQGRELEDATSSLETLRVEKNGLEERAASLQTEVDDLEEQLVAEARLHTTCQRDLAQCQGEAAGLRSTLGAAGLERGIAINAFRALQKQQQGTSGDASVAEPERPEPEQEQPEPETTWKPGDEFGGLVRQKDGSWK